MDKSRRYLSPEQKAAILREHLTRESLGRLAAAESHQLRFELAVGLLAVEALALASVERGVQPFLDKAGLDAVNLAHADSQHAAHVLVEIESLGMPVSTAEWRQEGAPRGGAKKRKTASQRGRKSLNVSGGVDGT